MSPTLRPALNDHLYVRDPQATELGLRIVAESIRLIDQIGFEQFTFKKLAAAISSTEAGIYRYFENKHRLLVYLVSWHWAGLRYQIRYHTHNVADARQRLRLALGVMCRAQPSAPDTSGLDEAALRRIVIAEASKSYLTKEVDTDNKAGFFREYKLLAAEVVAMVAEISPTYAYPHALVSTLLESARKQFFFAEHLPSLTDAVLATGPQVLPFLEQLAFAALA